MLIGIDLCLDIFLDPFMVLRVLEQNSQVFGLLQVQHLEELVAGLPILPSYHSVVIQCTFDQSTLLFKVHVQLSDAIDRVSFLPHQLQIGLLIDLVVEAAR